MSQYSMGFPVFPLNCSCKLSGFVKPTWNFICTSCSVSRCIFSFYCQTRDLIWINTPHIHFGFLQIFTLNFPKQTHENNKKSYYFHLDKPLTVQKTCTSWGWYLIPSFTGALYIDLRWLFGSSSIITWNYLFLAIWACLCRWSNEMSPRWSLNV